MLGFEILILIIYVKWFKIIHKKKKNYAYDSCVH